MDYEVLPFVTYCQKHIELEKGYYRLIGICQIHMPLTLMNVMSYATSNLSFTAPSLLHFTDKMSVRQWMLVFYSEMRIRMH